MELNHMKKELRQNNPNQSYTAPTSTYNKPIPEEPYRLGPQNTTDVVNESRIDRQLPGYSNNVNVSQMSFNQGVGNLLSTRFDQNVNMSRNQFPSRPMNTSQMYNDRGDYGNPSMSSNYDMGIKNSFHPQPNMQARNNYDRFSAPPDMRTQNQPFQNMGSSRVQNNSFGMGEPLGYPSNNVRHSPKHSMGGGGLNRGAPVGNNNAMKQGGAPTQEIEKGQLEQFSKFLMTKKGDIEAKLRTMPKVCRRVADKREKLQLTKELDEVMNELGYVQGLLRG